MESGGEIRTRLGGFRVESVLGEGATGIVYLAEEEQSGRRVALKLLSRDLAHDDRFRRRFLRETELVARLDHPNVVRTLASGEEDGTLYLAMQYIEGFDLRELLRREGRLEPTRALAILEQVAAALDAAHAAGVVHRDVKPANILIRDAPEGERAFVCDFGLARHVSSVSSLTTERGFVGTIDYVSPEQIEGGAVDGRADVYSLGCVLYECLTGAAPFARESELSIVYAHLNESPASVTDTRPELPTAFDAVFETALAKKPDRRYSSCSELVRAATEATSGKLVSGRRSRRRQYAIAAVILAGGTAAAIAAAVTHDGAPEPATASHPPAITQTSIDGVPLGLNRAAYEALIGYPGLLVYQQTETPGNPGTGYATLAFEDRKLWIFFADDIKGRANIITTWNRKFRTAAGVGPCSTIAELKAAYGDAVRPDYYGTIGKYHFMYRVGRNLLFAAPGPPRRPSKFVTAVGLFNGSAPHADEGRGARPFAGFVTGNETPPCRPAAAQAG